MDSFYVWNSFIFAEQKRRLKGVHMISQNNKNGGRGVSKAMKFNSRELLHYIATLLIS